MKKTILKITIFAAIITGASAWSRAADTNTMATAVTNAPVASEPAGPAKFYGSVTSVDASAKTFTVGDQTYTVTGESHLTKDGKPATLADAVVGEPARGSYTKGKDGKLDVTKARFGKAGGKGGGKKRKTAGAADATAPATPPPN